MLRTHATARTAELVIIIIIALFIYASPAQAQATETPDACATDGAQRWETVFAYATPTPTATPTTYVDIALSALLAEPPVVGDTVRIDVGLENLGTGAVTETVQVKAQQQVGLGSWYTEYYAGPGSLQPGQEVQFSIMYPVQNIEKIDVAANINDANNANNGLTLDYYPVTPTPAPCTITATVSYSPPVATVYTQDAGDANLYLDDVLVWSAPVAASEQITLPQWAQYGEHQLRLDEACYAYFGAPLANTEIYRDSADRVHVKRYEETTGDIMLTTALIVPSVVFLIIGILFGGYQFVKPNADHK